MWIIVLNADFKVSQPPIRTASGNAHFLPLILDELSTSKIIMCRELSTLAKSHKSEDNRVHIKQRYCSLKVHFFWINSQFPPHPIFWYRGVDNPTRGGGADLPAACIDLSRPLCCLKLKSYAHYMYSKRFQKKDCNLKNGNCLN